ncbi:hypothetical protein [Corynebacterium sp. HMSC071B10]|uniref:hypothetical protein n=1 Tax=Corynebacterium sp. HMSC071B10 TaxID=1739494 RepID=UPI00143B5572|nr:hypothetical protein [Corynebacterium sp. HMSC071B10]
MTVFDFGRNSRQRLCCGKSPVRSLAAALFFALMTVFGFAENSRQRFWRPV